MQEYLLQLHMHESGFNIRQVNCMRNLAQQIILQFGKSRTRSPCSRSLPFPSGKMQAQAKKVLLEKCAAQKHVPHFQKWLRQLEV